MVATAFSVEPANVVQALVNTLLDVFDATRDLYQTLSIKEQRDYELSLRAKGYPPSRHVEYVEDERLGSEEAIALDKATVTRQFEAGHQIIGVDFAIGDVLAHTALQSEIIRLQSVLVTTFLYGPTSSKSMSQQLANVNKASREAGTAAVDILAGLQRRQEELFTPPSQSRSIVTRSSANQMMPCSVPTGASTTSTAMTPHPVSGRVRTGYHGPASSASDAASNALMPYRAPTKARSRSPVSTTVQDWRESVQPARSEVGSRSVAGSTPYAALLPPDDLYCLYASDLQDNHTQSLSPSVTSDPTPHCPQCNTTLHLSPGKAWEVFKEGDGFDRCFQVSNRFVVKCHRGGPDGQYACVLCTFNSSSRTICGDVKALIKHIWEDHSIKELKREVDIAEVIEQPADRRRDSALGYSTSQSSRRSRSVASSRRRKSLPGYEREVDIFESRSLRRRA